MITSIRRSLRPTASPSFIPPAGVNAGACSSSAAETGVEAFKREGVRASERGALPRGLLWIAAQVNPVSPNRERYLTLERPTVPRSYASTL